MLLASHYSGRPLDPGADEVWSLASSGTDGRLRLVQWSDPKDLDQKLTEELESALELNGPEAELRFEESLGGTRYENFNHAFFWSKYQERPGAASLVDAWQILSPVRPGQEGVDAINRQIQARFRSHVKDLATEKGWGRKVPRPVGPQSLLYGDKVINVINQRRYNVWPKPEWIPYVANGDLGVIVGEYKTKKMRGMPKKLEVEFAGQLGFKYGFWPSEFGDDGSNSLELAYALTIHKTQGSQFRTTFVILPNPCRLLSRELLYTALTRHTDRLVVLHQGPLADFRRFAGEEYSEIARRMTNLFVDPSPREVIVDRRPRFLEEGLIHRTEGGVLVRSKSELVIANKLHSKNIEFVYEQPLVLPSGRTRYPDFTIADAARGVTYYWEHLGLLDDPTYRARWERKRDEYVKAGIRSWQDGGGDLGTLIETRDDPGGALDAQRIAEIIDQAGLA